MGERSVNSLRKANVCLAVSSWAGLQGQLRSKTRSSWGLAQGVGILTSLRPPPSFGLSPRVLDKDFFPWAPCSAGRTLIRTILLEHHGPEPVGERLLWNSGAVKIGEQGLPGRALAARSCGFSLGWGGSGRPRGRQRPSCCDLVTVPLLRSAGSVRPLSGCLSVWVVPCSLPQRRFPLYSKHIPRGSKNTRPNPPIFRIRAAESGVTAMESPGLLTARFDVAPASDSQAQTVPKIHITDDSSLKWLFNHLSKQQQASCGAVQYLAKCCRSQSQAHLPGFKFYLPTGQFSVPQPSL